MKRQREKKRVRENARGRFIGKLRRKQWIREKRLIKHKTTKVTILENL